MANVGKRIPISIPPGTNPNPDSTDNAAIGGLVSSSGVYWGVNGLLKAMEGNAALEVSDYGAPPSYYLNNFYGDGIFIRLFKDSSFIGSSDQVPCIFITENSTREVFNVYHSRLYGKNGGFDGYANIAPLSTSTTAIANSLDTDYRTLGTDALSITSGETTIVVSDSGHPYIVGNKITISGATTFGGLSSGNINRSGVTIIATTSSTWSYTAGATATSTASGGGASILLATRLIKVNASQSLKRGMRVKINSAINTGGINASASINIEHIAQSPSSTAFYIETDGFATSSVTGGGGASTTYQKQLTFHATTSTVSVDAFSDSLLVFCFGDKIYQWDYDRSEAIVVLTNAPTNNNYVFCSHNQVVTLGSDNIPNRFKTSDVGYPTEWTPGATTLAFEDDLENVGELYSHAPAINGIDVLFTYNQVILARYVGLPQIWDFEIISYDDGLLAGNARVVANGIIYWVGNNDFYSFNGASMEPLPNNTIREYFLDKISGISTLEIRKIFAFHVARWNSVGWTFPVDENGTKESILYNYESKFWYIDNDQTIFRQAAEQFSQKYKYPLFLDARGTSTSTTAASIYAHAVAGTVRGFDFTTRFEKIAEGDYTMDVEYIYPDSIQTGGNITITYSMKDEAQSASTTDFVVSDVTPTDTIRDVRNNGRYRQINVQSGSGLTAFAMGEWHESVMRGAPR